MKTIFETLLRELASERPAVLVTVVAHHGSAPRGAGAQMLVGKEGRLAGTIGGGTIELTAEKQAVQLLRQQRSCEQRFELGGGALSLDMICGGGVTAWLQYVNADGAWETAAQEVLERIRAVCPGRLELRLDGSAPTISDSAESSCLLADGCFSMPLPVGERAVIFGGGHCALALVPVLRSVGFRVTVFDERPEFVTRERFPDAERLLCGDYARLGEFLTLAEDDYLVVMTNGHRHDLEVEDRLLRGSFAYLGVMGSKKKTAAINEELLRRGLTEEDLRRVHTPIGIPIKSVTPEEIAVSIAAELIMVRAQRREQKNGEQKRCCPV